MGQSRLWEMSRAVICTNEPGCGKISANLVLRSIKWGPEPSLNLRASAAWAKKVLDVVWRQVWENNLRGFGVQQLLGHGDQLVRYFLVPLKEFEPLIGEQLLQGVADALKHIEGPKNLDVVGVIYFDNVAIVEVAEQIAPGAKFQFHQSPPGERAGFLFDIDAGFHGPFRNTDGVAEVIENCVLHRLWEIRKAPIRIVPKRLDRNSRPMRKIAILAAKGSKSLTSSIDVLSF